MAHLAISHGVVVWLVDGDPQAHQRWPDADTPVLALGIGPPVVYRRCISSSPTGTTCEAAEAQGPLGHHFKNGWYLRAVRAI